MDPEVAQSRRSRKCKKWATPATLIISLNYQVHNFRTLPDSEQHASPSASEARCAGQHAGATTHGLRAAAARWRPRGDLLGCPARQGLFGSGDEGSGAVRQREGPAPSTRQPSDRCCCKGRSLSLYGADIRLQYCGAADH